MLTVARIRTEFPAKFGVPRQAGLVPELRAEVVFEPDYRNPDAVRGLSGFSHLWLIWQFSQALREGWSPTVRPPRLGGEQRMGVFATRSPFRPNPIGLSAVELIEIRDDQRLGPVLVVGGADLVDGTPIWDIKPYVAADAHPHARFGFTTTHQQHLLDVDIPDELAVPFSPRQRRALAGILGQDPRPAYQRDQDREYGVDFAGHNVRFIVRDEVARVVSVDPL